MIHFHVSIPGNDTMAVALAEEGWAGETVKRPLGALVKERKLDGWRLTLMSHEPGEKALTGVDLTDTKIVPIQVGDIGAAKPWTQLALPDGRNGAEISGVGIYETTLPWKESGKRTVLDLGAVCDLYRLTVNGVEVPGANAVHPVQELTAYLKDGDNTIRVEVASNFFHAERSRDYLNCNWVERKPYTAWDFGLLAEPVLRTYEG